MKLPKALRANEVYRRSGTYATGQRRNDAAPGVVAAMNGGGGGVFDICVPGNDFSTFSSATLRTLFPLAQIINGECAGRMASAIGLRAVPINWDTDDGSDSEFDGDAWDSDSDWNSEVGDSKTDAAFVIR